MPANRTPLFVRLPQSQAAALDRLADRTGRAKQHLVSELLAERLRPDRNDLAVGRVEVSPPDVANDQVLTLDEVSALLKLSVDAVQARAEGADLPGRRFGSEWRFSRNAVLSWLASGERQKRTRHR
jgi:excisionase family DNA binding protein